MLKQRIEKELGISYESRLLIYDMNAFSDVFDYPRLLQTSGYQTFAYNSIEEFRQVYEQSIRYSQDKCAVIVTSDVYIPYDIQKAFFHAEMSYEKLFPNLDTNTLVKYREEMELISIAYDSLYSSIKTPHQTEKFVREKAIAYDTVIHYGANEISELKIMREAAKTYQDWIRIAKRVARLNYFGAVVSCAFDVEFVDEAFEQFVLSAYGKLSGEINRAYPPILPKAMNFITNNGTEKVALIVMDGMSLFDFNVLSRHMQDFKYEYEASFALIPTTTSISRQSLLSGKYPQQLPNPFSLSGEESEFIKAGTGLGYSKKEIDYQRGYDVEFNIFTRLACVIINEVDDIVHGQQHGRIGMLNSMEVLAESGKLQNLIRKIYSHGFTVYMTADHGNAPCTGIGNFRSGVEVETKSKRMVTLRDFAEETEFLNENTVLFPGTYLDKSYRYYICKNRISFDNKGDTVMTHGGISIDEVIVPFIRIVEVI